MIKKNNKKCLVCGTVYTYCPNCGEFNHLPKWMNIFHDENCMKIFYITTDYLAGNITADEARARYDACDLSNKDNFNTNTKRVLSEVYANKNVTTNTTPEPAADESFDLSKHMNPPVESKTDTGVKDTEWAPTPKRGRKKKVATVDEAATITIT